MSLDMGMLSHFAVCMMFLLLNSVVVLLWSSACPPPAHLGVALSGLGVLCWCWCVTEPHGLSVGASPTL